MKWKRFGNKKQHLWTFQSHLTINNYHCGQLLLLERGWVFFSNSGDFEELAGYFGDIVMLWYE